MEMICSLTLLCLALSRVGAITVNIPEETYEFARGDNITIPCTFKPKSTPILVVITWSLEGTAANPKELQIVSYYSTGAITDIKTLYEGRVSLDVDVAKGKADLKLSSVRPADGNMYECRVMIPNDDEGKPADKARVVVLVPPTPPICKIEGKSEYGQNINLTCVSEEGQPQPTYKWQSHDVKNTPRLASPRTTDKGGILSLFNISKETSGFYICTSSNKIRSVTCNVTLAIMPPSMNMGSTALIVGVVVAVVIILIIIIYCCCCRKKKKQQEEDYAMGVQGEEYHDKETTGNGDSRHVEGEEDRRVDDESSVRNPSDSRDRYDERNERDPDRRRDNDDRRSDYDDRPRDNGDRPRDNGDRPRDNDDRRSDYDDRPRDYDDRRSDYSERPRDYDDRRSDYSDRRSDYSDRRDRHADRNERHDDSRDRRYEDDRYDEPYDDREDDRPPVPANKPPRRDYDD